MATERPVGAGDRDAVGVTRDDDRFAVTKN
jgi:hypothetical protein